MVVVSRRTVLAVSTSMVILGACQGDDDRATVPERWRIGQATGLKFAYPPTLSPRPEGDRVKPKAAYELEGSQQGELRPPTLLVFVNRGPVGSLAWREDLLTRILKDQLPNFSFKYKRSIDVSGALGARALEHTFTAPDETEAPWTQIDVLVQTKGGPQYAIRYGAATSQWDEQMVQKMLDSLWVVQQ